MEIQIPSPSVFLRKSPIIRPQPDPPPSKKPTKARATDKPKPSKAAVQQNSAQDASIQKPKQSKSRNGCMTCKKKRLKCDETKPTCQQCAKRNVACEGYKKDYKWRAFDEANVPKAAPKPKKNHTRSHSFTPSAAQPRPITRIQSQDDNATGLPSSSWSPGNALDLAQSEDASHPELADNDADEPTDPLTPSGLSNLGPLELPDIPDGHPFSLPNTSHVSFDDDFAGRSGGDIGSMSPDMPELSLPGSRSGPSQGPDRQTKSPASFEELLNSNSLDENQSPIRTINPNETQTFGPFRQPSPAPSDASAHSEISNGTLMNMPPTHPGSPEMLFHRYNTQTCGIMSVKDGPHENPWRNLIGAMSRDCPALKHAVLAMTAFHGRHDVPYLGQLGIYHMRKSLKMLAGGFNTLPLDARLATTLVLAFSDGWDRSVVTGIQHLRGAKPMIADIIANFRNDLELGQLSIPDLHKWRFLCNTYIYMDVLSRLTSMEKSDNDFIDEVISTINHPFSELFEIDPLLGCAVSLFPLLSRTVHLCQTVRASNKMGLTMLSQAIELKEQLEKWQAPNGSMFERPEDRSSDVAHSIQTADAYRWAMLLYLHQAIPECPCPPVEVLARRVMMLLAGIPRTSPTLVIQIFPLLAAGCEAETDEDRGWVNDRWNHMRERLRIDKVDTCQKITAEVWRRRDEAEAEKQARHMMRFAHSSRRQQQRNMSGGSGDFSPPNITRNNTGSGGGGMRGNNIGLRSSQQQQSSGQQQGGGNNENNGGGGGGKNTTPNSTNIDNDLLFGMPGDFDDNNSNNNNNNSAGSPMKRRVTFDNMPIMIPIRHELMSFGNNNSGGNLKKEDRRAGEDFVVDQLDFDQTIKGRLHWLGVMVEQNWEVFIG